MACKSDGAEHWLTTKCRVFVCLLVECESGGQCSSRGSNKLKTYSAVIVRLFVGCLVVCVIAGEQPFVCFNGI